MFLTWKTSFFAANLHLEYMRSIKHHQTTLPKCNIAPVKLPKPNREVVFQPPFFRVCTSSKPNTHTNHDIHHQCRALKELFTFYSSPRSWDFSARRLRQQRMEVSKIFLASRFGNDITFFLKKNDMEKSWSEDVWSFNSKQTKGMKNIRKKWKGIRVLKKSHVCRICKSRRLTTYKQRSTKCIQNKNTKNLETFLWRESTKNHSFLHWVVSNEGLQPVVLPFPAFAFRVCRHVLPFSLKIIDHWHLQACVIIHTYLLEVASQMYLHSHLLL